jgi:hypothetical protein
MICNRCKQVVGSARCVAACDLAFMDGTTLAAIAHHDSDGAACGDCGVDVGSVHHGFCDQERCPRCKRQLLSCACTLSAMNAGHDAVPASNVTRCDMR